MDEHLLDRAFGFAFRAHAGQTDKLGEPYIGHVVRVAAAFDGIERQCTALLHDIVEDTQITLSDLARDFPDVVVRAVEAISRRQDEDYDVYLSRVAADPIAFEVKLADMADNSAPRRVAALPETDRIRLVQKYASARQALLSRREGNHANP